MADKKLVTIQIDGRDVEVPAGTSVVDAAAQAGVEIPIFCHHPRLEPVGMCRMCLVKVGTPAVDRATGEVETDEAGQPVIRYFPTLQAGCTMRASQGMVVQTEIDEVADARRSVLEFLLTSHPLDCPVCDKGGECPLQNLTMRYGPGQSRFSWGEKYRFEKPVPIGPLIALDRERCVLCARCIRFEDEIAGDEVLGFENRGRGMEVISFSDPPFESYFSGNTSDICPVGALTTKDFRFEARAWEVVGRPSVCGHCPAGCNTMVDGRSGQIERLMPRKNEAVNEIWLCDKGRFAHHHASDPDRLTTPLVRQDGQLVEASWDEALGLVAERLSKLRDDHGAQAIGGLAGAGLPNEDLYLFGRFIRAVVGSPHLDHRPALLRDDVIARAGWRGEPDFNQLGEGDCVLLSGLDAEEEAPMLYLGLRKALRQGASVILLSAGPQKLESEANLALRYQASRPESALAALIRAALAADERQEPSEGLEELAAAVEAFDAERIAGVHPLRATDLEAAARAMRQAERLVIAFGPEMGGRELAAAHEALLAAAGKAGREGSGLVAVGAQANSQGAADMGLMPGWLPGYRHMDDADARAELAEIWPSQPAEGPGLDAEAMLAGEGPRALYILGTNPAGDDPAYAEALEALDFLVVQELFLTRTAQLADVVLPALSSLERGGSFTNLGRRVQRFQAGCDPVGQGRPDWRILCDLGLRMGVSEPYSSPSDIFDEIARALPAYRGMSHAELGRVADAEPTDIFLPFAPQTESRHVSYEGTAYGSEHGTGRVWPVEDRDPEPPTWRPAEAGDAADRSAPKAASNGHLRLRVTRRLLDLGTVVAASRILHPLVPEPLVEISAFDAGPRRLGQGDRVRLSGPGGSAEARVEIRDGITPGWVQAPESLAWTLSPRAIAGGEAAAEVELEALDDRQTDQGPGA